MTGVKSSFTLEAKPPYTALLMKFTRARLVFVLKMANSGPFNVVWGMGLSGGKKLKTLPELKTFCDMFEEGEANCEPSVWPWNARATLTTMTAGSRSLPSLGFAVALESPLRAWQQRRVAAT